MECFTDVYSLLDARGQMSDVRCQRGKTDVRGLMSEVRGGKDKKVRR